ncbi:MAG: hypothetical protein KGM99_20120, partial [Burkholderiales bacterium]|nr:hypothetical protein [Burkholderiales bacterium]
FAGMPGITKLETPRDWGKIIASQAADLSEIKTWYSNFMSSYCFEGNIMRNNSDLSGLRGVINSTMA